MPIVRRRNSITVSRIDTFSRWQTHHFLSLRGPSSRLAVNFKRLGQSLTKDIDIATGQFPEPNTSNDDYMPETKTMAKSQPTKLSHLDRLEAESLYIIREVMAHAENPVMMYSVGKDSAVMLHLARKAFYPSPPPFPLMHVDTRWKFQAMYDFRDAMAKARTWSLLFIPTQRVLKKTSTL